MSGGLARLKRTRAANVARRVLRGRPEPLRESETRPLPLLSVVVPVYDAAPYLADCLDSLAQQTYGNLEVVLVDDGSTDGSRVIAERYVAEHSNFVLVSQPHGGVGSARNRGVQQATGAYLAFCDADDLVRPAAYERMAAVLESSGSDIAIGSVSMQRYGRFAEPDWARRSNARRQLRATLGESPQIMANQILGARVFRRSFWDAGRFEFPTDVVHPDASLLVRSMLEAGSFDVVPAVVYLWRWREDHRSLVQHDLRDPVRVAQRVDGLARAGELLVEKASQPVQQHFFAEILHTTAPDLVRAAVCRNDGYWESLGVSLRRVLELMSSGTLHQVPVEDRVVAWLCANDERAVAEDFLEYAWDNRLGYPHRRIDGNAYIDLPFTAAIVDADDDLLRVADADMRYRTRLTAMRWHSPGILRLEGGAFIEYVGDDAGESEIHLLIREMRTGVQLTVATDLPTVNRVNKWSERANEDHRGGAFTADIDVEQLRALVPETERLKFEVLVRLRIAGHERTDVFQTRHTNGSAGFLEVSRSGDTEGEPIWRDFRGLALALRPARQPEQVATEPGSAVVVEEISPAEDVVELSGTAPAGLQLALQGPRSGTSWVEAKVEDGRFKARLSVMVDEWGFGPRSLPMDVYEVMGRTPDGTVEQVYAGGSLRRRLPELMTSGPWNLAPNTAPDGRLFLRVEPVEVKSSRPPYFRRHLRDEVYAAARVEPLLPTVLLETFASKAAGDHPGALCEELVRRGYGLDLVFSVFDRSVVVPEGARSVVRWSREWHELLGRAQYIVSNAAMPYFFVKRADQTFLQTWHGTPLKQIAHDRPNLDFDNWHHRRQLSKSVDGWDYLVSQSEFCTRALRSAFRYEGEVLELGNPRNDLLRAAEADSVRARTREHLGLSDDQWVVLYAPTWRDNMRQGRAVFNKVVYLDTHAVAAKLDNAVVLVRGHYNTIGAANSAAVEERVIDVTRYPDISDLYLAADALVTDYSSVFFDFVLTDKPMAFLAPDLDYYRDETRGFYLDYHETVPGPVCDSTDEVIEVLSGPDEFAGVRERFRARFTPRDDGHASERVVDAVFGSSP